MQYEQRGLARRCGERWRLTPEGFLLSNQIIGELLEIQEQATLADTQAALTATEATLADTQAALAATEAALAATEATLASTEATLADTEQTLGSTRTTMTSMLAQNALAPGYGGDVTVTAIINENGVIAHLLVDASSETEGIGQKVMETEFLAQFLGKTLPVTLGEDVDAVAGATISSQAVVDALNLLSTQYDNTINENTVVNQRSVVSEVTYVLTQPGYSSTLKVTVKMDPNGTITSLRIDASGEGNGAAVMDSEFRNQFIGRSVPVALGAEVDAVSGATETSQAIVDLLNRLAD